MFEGISQEIESRQQTSGYAKITGFFRDPWAMFTKFLAMFADNPQS